MRFFTYILSLIGVGLLYGGISHGRLSIIPEYDQNMVTILFSAHRSEEDAQSSFLFSVPSDVDSVSQIETLPDGDLNFIRLPALEKDGMKWVEVPQKLIEFAFMINCSPFPIPGPRTFEYNLSFSQTVQNLNLEIQEPLAAEKFVYDGFVGKSSTDAHGQTTHAVELNSISAKSKRFFSFSYLNPRGLTTRSALAELMTLSQQEGRPVQPMKKIKRHKLYIWEPLAALGVVTLITAIIMMVFQNGKNNSLTCTHCGLKLNSGDKFCPGCGEKI